MNNKITKSTVLKDVITLPILDKIKLFTELTTLIADEQNDALKKLFNEYKDLKVFKPKDTQSVRLLLEDYSFSWNDIGTLISSIGEDLSKVGFTFDIHCIYASLKQINVSIQIVITPVPYILRFLITDLDEKYIVASELTAFFDAS